MTESTTVYRYLAKRQKGVLVVLLPLTLMLLGAGKCPTYDRWRHADKFAAQLQCGMSRDEIAKIAESYPRLELHVPDSNLVQWNLVALKGNTRIKMKLDEMGLQRYAISWIDTIKHVTTLPEVNLCGTDEPRAP